MSKTAKFLLCGGLRVTLVSCLCLGPKMVTEVVYRVSLETACMHIHAGRHTATLMSHSLGKGTPCAKLDCYKGAVFVDFCHSFIRQHSTKNL